MPTSRNDSVELLNEEEVTETATVTPIRATTQPTAAMPIPL